MPKSNICKASLLLTISCAVFYFLLGCVAAPGKEAEEVEMLEAKEIPSGQAQSPKVASISDDKKRKKEPWSGIWYVEGALYSGGVWAMKQRGKKVVSTKESYYELAGKVNGSQLKGRLLGDAGLVFSFVIDISSDGQSFEGKIHDYWGTAHIKGQRKE